MRVEVQQLFDEVTAHKEKIVEFSLERKRRLSSLLAFDMLPTVTLEDIFRLTDKARFPLLWRQTLIAQTIMPTTVACEQSLSVIKHTRHINMSNETFLANVINKIHERTEEKQL